MPVINRALHLTATLLALSSLSPALPQASSGFDMGLLVPSDVQTDDIIGDAVSISGTQAIVGGRGHIQPGGGAGSAWVFERDLTGSWFPATELINSDQVTFGKYGRAVGIDNNVAAVGNEQDPTIATNAGTVFVFEKDTLTGAWLQTAKLLASDHKIGYEFGTSLAVDGGLIVVGAPNAKDLSPTGSTKTPGAAYVFERQVDGSWVEVQKLVASDIPHLDEFGVSVDMDGDRIVIGCHKDDDNGSSSGSAYLFERQLDGSWLQVAKFLASDGDSNDNFGFDVGISGDQIVCGAWRDIDDPGVDGSAYVFERNSGGAWLETAKLVAGVTAGNGHFGQSVDIDNGVLLSGAFNLTIHSKFETGAVYRYENQVDGTWPLIEVMTMPDPQFDDHYGSSVAIDGNWILAGARKDDDPVKNGGSAQLTYSFKLGSANSPILSGMGTPGCNGLQTMALLEPPLLGASTFSITCDNAPPSSAGFLVIGGAPDVTGNDLLGLGVLLHLDLLADPNVILFGMPSDATGLGTTAIPIPATPGLAGFQLHAQTIWPWTGTCNLPPLDLSSSNLLTFTLLAA